MSVAGFITAYLVFINAVGLLVMGLDKLKAIKRGFRIPEATLFIIALMGGSLGIFAGMYVFRHKTRKRKFTVGIPVILIAQLALAAFLYFGPVRLRTI